MKKRYLFIVSVLIFLCLIFSTYQYGDILRLKLAKAYNASKSANGHSWSELQCTSDLCIVDGKIGIGTDSPTEKLTVVGNLKVSGDVCNGAGNCLSALAALTNACGAAATTYIYTATAFSGAYCATGNPTPAAPAWPAQGESVSWTCPVTNGSPISCTAIHANP